MKRLLILTCFFFIGMTTSNTAHSLSLNFFDGTTSKTIVDDQSGDINPLSGVITFGGSMDGWLVNVTTGITYPVIGSNYYPVMDLNSVNVTGNSGGTLQISLHNDGFSAPPGWTMPLSLAVGIGGTTDGIIQLETYIDESNSSTIGAGTPVSSLGPFGPIAFSGTDNFDISDPDMFALTMVANITHSGGGQSSSFNASVAPVPEPATVFLLGTGLAGLVGLRRRFRFRNT